MNAIPHINITHLDDVLNVEWSFSNCLDCLPEHTKNYVGKEISTAKKYALAKLDCAHELNKIRKFRYNKFVAQIIHLFLPLLYIKARIGFESLERLSDVVIKEGVLSIEQAGNVSAQLYDGLVWLIQRQYYLLDLCPNRIGREKWTNRIRIYLYGCCVSERVPDGNAIRNAPRTGACRRVLSPERILGRLTTPFLDLSYAIDSQQRQVYSLGSLTVYCIFGKTMFDISGRIFAEEATKEYGTIRPDHRHQRANYYRQKLHKLCHGDDAAFDFIVRTLEIEPASRWNIFCDQPNFIAQFRSTELNSNFRDDCAFNKTNCSTKTKQLIWPVQHYDDFLRYRKIQLYRSICSHAMLFNIA